MVRKKLIRNEIFRRRKNAAPEDLERWSSRIQHRICDSELYKESDTIYTYVAYKREVETKELICRAWKDGKRVAVPRVEGKEMNFYYITSMSELKESEKGIPEPTTLNPASDEDALMVMPGVAFDKNKNRIGYGGGYYDKYLEVHPHMKKVAIAYEFQFVDETLPTEPTDICPELIITENRVFS